MYNPSRNLTKYPKVGEMTWPVTFHSEMLARTRVCLSLNFSLRCIKGKVRFASQSVHWCHLNVNLCVLSQHEGLHWVFGWMRHHLSLDTWDFPDPQDLSSRIRDETLKELMFPALALSWMWLFRFVFVVTILAFVFVFTDRIRINIIDFAIRDHCLCVIVYTLTGLSLLVCLIVIDEIVCVKQVWFVSFRFNGTFSKLHKVDSHTLQCCATLP